MTGPMTFVERRIVIGAVMTTFFLVALDQTILAAATPRIITDLHGLSRYGWLTTAYLLSSTVMVPIYGKIADMYGRRIVLLIGTVLFLLGSTLCGLSGEFGDLPVIGDGMNQLIVFRAVQGLGGAALFMSAWVIVADLYAPLERGRIMGGLAAVYGGASVLGPLIGGVLTDHGAFDIGRYHVDGWRTVFYVNLPLGVVALAAIAAWMPKLGGGKRGRIDVAGAALILTTFIPLLLALTWAGRDYAWISAPILGLLLATAASLVLLIVVERRAAHPMIPLGLFANRTITWCTIASFLAGFAFLGYAMFLPLYMQVVQGHAATQSGLSMLPMTLTFIASSVISGQIVSRTGRPKPVMIAGSIFAIAGIAAILTIHPDTGPVGIGLRLILAGIGMGPAQNLLNLVSQTAADKADIGAATALSQFSRQIGATMGIALFTTVMTQRLAVDLDQIAAQQPAIMAIETLNGDVAQATIMHGAPALGQTLVASGVVARTDAGTEATAILTSLRTAFASAITGVFWAAAIFVALGFLATMMIPDMALKKPVPVEPDPTREGELAVL